MSLQVAQIFHPNSLYAPSKASLFLRPAGTSSTAFTLSSTEDIVIDASNWKEVQQASIFKLVFDDSLTGYTGAGYAKIIPPNQQANNLTVYNSAIASALSANGSPGVSFPIQATDERLYYIFFRVAATGTYFRVRCYLDGQLVSNLLVNSPTGSWQWVGSSFVAFDSTAHDLLVTVESADLKLDKIVISSNATTPTSTGPSLTISPYLTAHVRLSQVSSSLPTTYLTTEASHTTLDDIVKAGWYNFNTSSLDVGITGSVIAPANHSDLGAVLTVSGTSDSLYLVWDTANTYLLPSAVNSGSGWSVDNTETMALRIYSDNASIDNISCTMTTPEAVLTTVSQDDLSDPAIHGILNNTIYTDDMDGGKDVELDVTTKTMPIIIDQSGSMTWNDSEGSRFTFAQNIVDILEAKYPANLNFDLFEFHGEPCFPLFISLTTPIASSKVSDLVKAYFANDSSGFAGFRVIRKKGSYSTSFIDGEIVSDGYALAALDISLEQDTDYYYTVYTYDQQLRPSRGVQLIAPTREKIIPRGMPNIRTGILQGYDVKRDSDMLALWNMDEGSGSYIYDFADSGITLTQTNATWLDVFDSPAGVSGLRLNGLNSSIQSQSTTDFALNGNPMTICFWIQPLDSGANRLVIARSNSSALNYAVTVNNGFVNFIYGAITYACTTALTVGTWYHIAIVISTSGNVLFYVNGQFKNLVIHSVPSTTTGSMSFNIGYDPSGTFSTRFFGKISHISLHDIDRDSAYILDVATPSHGTQVDGTPTPVDNGDRAVVFNYVIPDDANYDFFRIVFNANHMPSWEGDGTSALELTAIPGRYSTAISLDYDVAHTAYFRVFTQNSIGNWCAIEDATQLTVNIPDIIRPPIVLDDVLGDTTSVIPGPGDAPDVPLISGLDVRSGNEKVYFKWDIPDDPATRVVIYYSANACPYYDAKTQTIMGGTIVFNATKSVSEFVHRQLPNRQPGYYVVVPTDKLNRFNRGFQCVQSFPREGLDDSGIPLLEVSNLSYHLMDYDRIRISWDSPVTISSTQTGYFDDTFYCYGAICDMYGNPIPFEFPDNVQILTSVNNISVTEIEDVFGLQLDPSNADQLPQVSFHVNSNGFITGSIRLRQSNLFAVLTNFTINITANYQLSSDYNFAFPAAQVIFNNPVDLTLENRDALYFGTVELVPPGGCQTSLDAGGTGDTKSPTGKQVNGIYIRRQLPFTIRALYDYKGKIITSANVQLKLFDATGGPCAFLPNTNTISTTVLASNATLINSVNTVPIVDVNGNPTGDTEQISYTDIGIVAPQLPQGATAYILVQANGYIALRKMHIIFPSILKMAITASAPATNNVDVREQFAMAYLVNPDDPTNQSKITIPPDNTVAKWVLTPPAVITRLAPFYSTDNVPLTGGVYSYFRNGGARNVFFGPAQANAAGTYTITVSTTLQGLFASASDTVIIQSFPGGGVFPPISNPKNPRILAEFPNCVNYVWTDGIDYQKMTITRDPTPATHITEPTRSNTKYADAFRSCATADAPIIALAPNSTVTISAQGWEIIWGIVVEKTTIGGVNYLDTTDANTALDVATVVINKDPYTYVYFRQNSQVLTPKTCYPANISSCVCTDAPATICKAPYDLGTETEVILSSKINYSGKPLTIYGGGGRQFDGRPPTLLIPVDPLYIRFLGLFVDNVPVNDFVIDGVTTNYMYFELRFDGNPVPDNTEVIVGVVADRTTFNNEPVATALNVPLKVYTRNTTNLPGGVTNPTPLSLVTVPVGPVPTGESIKFAVYIQTSYSATAPVA